MIPNSSIAYKPEVDGLRAIAVLSVLLCHMQIAGATGGYVGVDIFFVISGFLITSTLLKNSMEGRLSFWQFYGRRFVRLYPALIAAVTLTFIAGFLIMDPESFKNLARTGKYAIRSTSNLFFNTHMGYFDVMAARQPFLHTWSLGVEWQFYLIWPFLIYFTVKYSRKLLVALLAMLSVASLIASQWMLNTNPNAAYYLMPFRAFELGFGALLVFIYHRKLSLPLSILLTLAGFGSILLSCYIYSDHTPFPGFAALLPCLGAAACIYGAQGFTKGNLFKTPVMVYIGKTSYSIYLVHWPILVLYTYYVFRTPTTTERIALFVASLLLGFLFYTCVEKRITWKRLPKKLAGCLIMLAIAIAINFICSYAHKHDGLPARLAKTELSQQPDYTTYGYKAYSDTPWFGKANTPPIAYFAGDSFAAAMAFGLHKTLLDEGLSARFGFTANCMIQWDFEKYSSNETCAQFSRKTIQDIKEQKIPLVLVESWGRPLTDYFLIANDFKFQNIDQYQEYLQDNLDTIHQKIGLDTPLILVGTPIYLRWGGGGQECLLRPPYLPQVCSNLFKDYKANTSVLHQVNRFLENYANTHTNVYYIDIEDISCPGGTCSLEMNAKLYPDGVHFSRYGSRLAADKVVKQLQKILNVP